MSKIFVFTAEKCSRSVARAEDRLKSLFRRKGTDAGNAPVHHSLMTMLRAWSDYPGGILTKPGLKVQASAMAASLSTLGSTSEHALEAAAALLGYRNWDVLSAALPVHVNFDADARKLLAAYAAAPSPVFTPAGLDIMERLIHYEQLLLKAADGAWSLLEPLREDDEIERWGLNPILIYRETVPSEECDLLLSQGDIVSIEPEDLSRKYTFAGKNFSVSYLKAGAEARKLGVLHINSKTAEKRWEPEFEKAEKEERRRLEDKEVSDLCRHMVVGKKKYGAVYRACPPGDGRMEFHEIRSWENGNFTLHRPRGVRSTDGMGISLLSWEGCVGIVVHGHVEVNLPTRKAYERAGVVFRPGLPHAPDGWEKAHAAWRRDRNAKSAKDEEVRVFSVYQDEESYFDESESEYRLARKGDVYFEGSLYSGSIARWTPGSDVVFDKPYGSSLDPFTGQRFPNPDDLVAALRADGRYVTDYRKAIGEIDDLGRVLELVSDGWILEERGAHSPWILMLPRVCGSHGDIFLVNREVGKKASAELPKIGCGPAYSLSRGIYGMQEKEASPISKAATKKRSDKKTVKKGLVVAYDDDGLPITEADLVRESYRRPMKGHDFAVLAPFNHPGGQEAWETMRLVEDVKLRRAAF